MKSLIKTLAILLTLNLIALSPTLAQEASKEQKKAAREAQAAVMKAQAEVQKAQAEVRKEAELAKKQPELAQKQAEAAIKQAQANVLAAQAAVRNAAKKVDTRLLSLKSLGAMPPIGAGPVLVIPSAQMKAEDLAAITEDTNIMARIFEKRLQEAHISSPRSSSYNTFLYNIAGDVPHRFFTSSRHATESVYLDGFGVIFMMQVDFPLSPLPKAPEPNEPREDTDPLWSQTKRQIYTPQEYKKRTDRSPQKEYDAEKVETLRRTLVKALKHAANIRNLQHDHSVILAVRGHVSEQNVIVTDLVQSFDSAGRSTTQQPNVVTLRDVRASDAASSNAAVLIIRAKKSDIDAFSKGDLDYDEFRKRCEFLTY